MKKGSAGESPVNSLGSRSVPRSRAQSSLLAMDLKIEDISSRTDKLRCVTSVSFWCTSRFTPYIQGGEIDTLVTHGVNLPLSPYPGEIFKNSELGGHLLYSY
jgi:hypothetical protein